jgi:hypothetical protein
MSSQKPRRKGRVPPVETATVRVAQPLNPLLIQSVHFAHLDNDGRVTTDSVLDLATRPYSGATFNFTPSPDLAIMEPFDDSFFDSPSDAVSNNAPTQSLPDLSPSKTIDSVANPGTSPVDAPQSDISDEVGASFFEIDLEDEVVNIHTGEKKVPKRPHQVSCILNRQ